jgi:HAD superfamily hydrolase (TIGR01490 family)
MVLALHHADHQACSGADFQADEDVSAVQANKPVVAAFDFDGTLTRRDTMFPFLMHTLGMTAFVRNVLVLSPTLAGYGLGLIGNDIAKERVFVRCLAGMNMDVLRQKSGMFATNVVPGLLRPEAMQRLRWHKQQGHRCVVISASLELYVQPWAINAGFDDVIATHLQTREEGHTTGKLDGANCFGMEKVRRLQALLGDRDGYTLLAYGDSRGDKELLSSADYAYYRQFPNQ